MTNQQHRIGSGFGFQTTADEVLAGIDLSDRLAIVAGGYSGLGLATTRALAGAGAHVVVPARRPSQARQQVDAEVDELDLADQASVHAFADRFLASGRRIDLVINSAGVMALPETRVWAATSPQLATLGGLYLEDCDVAAPTDSATMESGVRDYALDAQSAARLWRVSAELTGVDA